MDETSSGFGDESPILFKYQKLAYEFHSKNEHFTVDDLHKELILHLKKTRNFSRDELKSFSEQVNKVSPDDPKTRWLLRKIRGLLSFILKKRADFQNCIVKGKIAIYEKSNVEHCSPATMSTNANTNSANFPSNMLTNNNFVSVAGKKENEKSYNYSEDLFNTAETTENLYNFSQENYQLLKSLTQNSILKEIPKNDDKIFKVPSEISGNIENVYQIHEKIQDNFKSLITSAATTATTSLEKYKDNDISITCDAAMENTTKHKAVNIFDQLTENTEDLKNEFHQKLEETKRWVSEIIANFMKLDVKKKYKVNNNANPHLNESSDSITELQTFYSEENFRIVKETCQKFKANLHMKKNFEVLQNYDFLL